jgi:peptidoglycan-N-acetylglucosamine deacetylase
VSDISDAAGTRGNHQPSPSVTNSGWLRGKAAVVCLTFDVDAEFPILAEGRRFADHAMVLSHQAYRLWVGVPRILALLADFSLTATFFVPGLTAERYPGLVERIVEAGLDKLRD